MPRQMRREFWEALNEGFVKIGSVGLQRYKRESASTARERNLDCRYLPVHKLIFRRRSLQPIFCEQHWIFSVVDVQEDLHWDHCLNVL